MDDHEPKIRGDLLPHVWRDSVLVCVITMPGAERRCDGCEASFTEAGFPPPLRVAGSEVSPWPRLSCG